jgi:pyruvate formate lyase activating enzyme
MKIKGFIKNTFIEYPGKIAAMIFLPNCNFRCSFCFNPELIEDSEKIRDVDEKEVFDFLEKQKKWIDALIISGGEPLLHKDLPEFIKKIKRMGYLVRIYTNGTNPDMLKELIDNKLIDSIAMDIKAPLNEESYEKVTNVKGMVEKVKDSIELITNSSIDNEMRSTVLPSLHSKEDIIEMAKSIRRAKMYCLQQFRSEKTLDPKFKNCKAFTQEELEIIKEECNKYVPTELRI